MILGRVIGEIHGTIKHRFYEGHRMLIVEKTAPDGQPTGDYVIAIDAVGAGADERVLVNDEGNGARPVFESKDGPVRSVVVGIIDDVMVV
jgi:microcompartment protein CcmK/EutM